MKNRTSDSLKTNRLAALVVVTLLGSSAPIKASTGTTGASFLDIPVGAGPAAMGSAYSALATDAYAPVWNPAGLGFVDAPEVAAQHLSYLQSVHYEFLSAVVPFHKAGALGVSAQYIGSGDIDATDGSGTSLGTYSNTFAAYSLAYGLALNPRLSLGLTGKVIEEKLADVSATAYAGDVGLLWKALDHVKVAATMANAGKGIEFDQQRDDLPLAFHLATAWDISRMWLASAEGVAENGALNGRFGLQCMLVNGLSLRAGYRTDNLSNLSPLAGFSTGLGLTVWGQEFQYAWVPYGDLGDSQYFSLLFHFGATPEGHNLAHLGDHADTKPLANDADREQISQLLLQVNDQ